jgi:hypothetical protein
MGGAWGTAAGRLPHFHQDLLPEFHWKSNGLRLVTRHKSLVGVCPDRTDVSHPRRLRNLVPPKYAVAGSLIRLNGPAKAEEGSCESSGSAAMHGGRTG